MGTVVADEWLDSCDICDEQVDLMKGEDLFFEVSERELERIGRTDLKPNALTCVDCWESKGYGEVYWKIKGDE